MYFAQYLVLGKASKNVSKTKTYVLFHQKTQREENVPVKATRGRLLQKHVCGRALQQPEKQNKTGKNIHFVLYVRLVSAY